MTGDHGLCPFALITAADSIDLGRRSRPDALNRIVAGFAEKFGHARFFQNELVSIHRKFAPCFALPILQRLHAIIESCDCHTTLAIMKCGQ